MKPKGIKSGPSRKPATKKTGISVSLSKANLDFARSRAKREGRSLSGWIERLIRDMASG